MLQPIRHCAAFFLLAASGITDNMSHGFKFFTTDEFTYGMKGTKRKASHNPSSAIPSSSKPRPSSVPPAASPPPPPPPPLPHSESPEDNEEESDSGGDTTDGEGSESDSSDQPSHITITRLGQAIDNPAKPRPPRLDSYVNDAVNLHRKWGVAIPSLVRGRILSQGVGVIKCQNPFKQCGAPAVTRCSECGPLASFCLQCCDRMHMHSLHNFETYSHADHHWVARSFNSPVLFNQRRFSCPCVTYQYDVTVATEHGE